tara:strand:- start:131 stop:658 length:528 start_codon:yes stop_codon:yes gene_type:complete
MGQEFIIKSETLEDKINQLLPSQGGFQAGVDLSASTTIIPIVDLTESAEGSNLRQDLQTAFSLNNVTRFEEANSNTDLISTPGFYRIFGNITIRFAGGGTETAEIKITDGTSTKAIYKYSIPTAISTAEVIEQYDFNVFLKAGDTLNVSSNDSNIILIGVVRQLADVNGNLINPT